MARRRLILARDMHAWGLRQRDGAQHPLHLIAPSTSPLRMLHRNHSPLYHAIRMKPWVCQLIYVRLAALPRHKVSSANVFQIVGSVACAPVLEYLWAHVTQCFREKAAECVWNGMHKYSHQRVTWFRTFEKFLHIPFLMCYLPTSFYWPSFRGWND